MIYSRASYMYDQPTAFQILFQRGGGDFLIVAMLANFEMAPLKFFSSRYDVWSVWDFTSIFVLPPDMILLTTTSTPPPQTQTSKMFSLLNNKSNVFFLSIWWLTTSCQSRNKAKTTKDIDNKMSTAGIHVCVFNRKRCVAFSTEKRLMLNFNRIWDVYW